MTAKNPLVYVFPRDGKSNAEPIERSPTSRAPGDDSVWPALPMTATSISSLVMNLGGVDAGEIPELILLCSEPLQIWFDGEHLIESPDRHATVGKYYLHTIGEVELVRVEEIESRSPDEVNWDVPERAKELMESPADKLTTRRCYCLTHSDPRPYPGGVSGGPRMLFEDDGTLSTDSPPIPFETIESVLEECGTTTDTH